ncbi:MAG: hypothetical protein ACI4DN_02210 [Lachnospiraceae bacterium]
MNRNVKWNIGNFVINLGKHSIGKCMVLGMFDPEIPKEIRENNADREYKKEKLNKKVLRK